MKVKIWGNQEHKGFLLENSIVTEESILVVTGKNGSGKTRLLESIQCGKTILEVDGGSLVLIDGFSIKKSEVKYFSNESMTPKFGEKHSEIQYSEEIRESLKNFEKIKEMVHKGQQYIGVHSHLAETHRILESIKLKSGKELSDIMHDDIELHYIREPEGVVGEQNISRIFNTYIRKVEKNKFNHFIRETYRENVIHYDDETFKKIFGEKPWVLINRILNEVFDGKFEFSIPDENSRTYDFEARLIEKGEIDRYTAIQQLSQGEQKIMWLAITLFNSQYYSEESTKRPRCLLIDEPDCFLHPKMVVKMYDAIKSFSRHFKTVVIITTHSPTTVALAPTEDIHIIENNSIKRVGKDDAIADLLHGVTQISLDPKNRRQVFVESIYDAEVYQDIFTRIAHASILDPKITLNFVSSGPKMEEKQIRDCAKKHLSETEQSNLDNFIASLNGVGASSMVIAQVQALSKNGHTSVRGLIDWDLKNKEKKNICVLGENYAYAIENVTLDPACIQLALHLMVNSNVSMKDICGENINWHEWLQSEVYIQKSVDIFIKKILARENAKNQKIEYMSGKTVLTDKEYLEMNGHDLEGIILEKFERLKEFIKRGEKEGQLKRVIVREFMIKNTDGKLIPKILEKALHDLQKK